MDKINVNTRENENICLSFHFDSEMVKVRNAAVKSIEESLFSVFDESNVEKIYDDPSFDSEEVIFRIIVPALKSEGIMNDFFSSLLFIIIQYEDYKPHFTQVAIVDEAGETF